MSLKGQIARRLRIKGRVQGVGYRAWTIETARGLRLSGWVRNRLDGSVEALVVGDAADVEEMIGACWKGPSMALVDTVVVEPAQGIIAGGFSAKPTV